MVMLWLACGEAPEPAFQVAPEPVEEPEAAPSGRIGGEPILDRPVVLGGIATADVEAVVNELDWLGCHKAGSGKVLVQMSLAANGSVSETKVASTSLRNPETEDCLLALLDGSTFPPLVTGEKAIVKYTFAY